jgi:predicted transcriptional regulator
LSHQGKKNKKKIQNTTKCPKFKCNTISVSFSACRCSSVVVSSKEERKKKVWRQVCEWLSEAVSPLPTAVSLLLLEALFVQISGVSLALTWPLRLCLLRVLL